METHFPTKGRREEKEKSLRKKEGDEAGETSCWWRGEGAALPAALRTEFEEDRNLLVLVIRTRPRVITFISPTPPLERGVSDVAKEPRSWGVGL